MAKGKKKSHNLNGDGWQVELGQEYRILVYDRKHEDYGFITLKQRREPFHTSLLGKNMEIIRHCPETAYVFRISQNYPSFSTLRDAKKWAENHCLEKREIPNWWRVESDTYEKQALEHVQSIIKDYPPKPICHDYSCCYDGYYGDDDDVFYDPNYWAAINRKKQDLNYHI